ncbi:casein kinase II, regulatory subunit [Dipodascopsis tothii]|uniref:casein kinase II, regulatory subunit n=1 Tax=Dipodascopsis tothii TaxID=44089 RepID=UPI0034CE6AD4
MMDDYSSGSESDYTKYWVDWFLGTKGNEYFCEIDEEFIMDRFNLTGLNTEVAYYQYAIDLITDSFDHECNDDIREQIERSARHLYGLIHARYILTQRGLQKMLDKYKNSDFGKCPRVHCNLNPLLPVGLSDVPHSLPVKLFCMRCEDIYNPKSNRHASIDGAYFGSSFPGVLFQVYPHLVPSKNDGERYVSAIFGFKVHDSARLARWQEGARQDMLRRLEQLEKDEAAR